MEISDLIVFKAVVEHKGVTRAAEALHRVPSNITARIKKLEAELNIDLFIREHNRLVVTSAGLRLLEYTQQILQLQKNAIAELTQSEPSGLLRLGSMESSAASYLPSLLSKYHVRYPDVQVELMTAASEPLIDKVLKGELDLVMTSDPPNDARLLCSPFCEEELVLIMPQVWQDEQSLPSPLTMVSYNKGCSYRQRLETWLKRHDVRCERVIEIPSHYTMLACVVAGMGIGMVPKSLLSLHQTDGLANRQVDKDIAQATIYLVARKDNPASAISAFVELATTV
ncbi:LysR substrate-binding domain-containing protein [Marinomonas sp. THO17]|uniref:LysR family transcriptional regulator n=1 Tax=Marinomonas sp. THO17 TaxID=3149048 RepID=UPI00336BE401